MSTSQRAMGSGNHAADPDQTPYERDVLPFVRPFTHHLLATVDVPEFQALLDHGSGTGEVVQQLRDAGYCGSVTALEPNAGMAQRLRTNIATAPDTSVFEGYLPDFLAQRPGVRFDLITSQLVLSFVHDPQREL